MSKVCTKCNIYKEDKDFSFKNKALGKLHSQCKECRRKSDNSKYASNIYRQRNIRERQKSTVNSLKEYVNHIKMNSTCSICGDVRWYVLDFHHIGEKKFNISDKVKCGCSIETLEAEISKCIIICTNCHRELHYKKH